MRVFALTYSDQVDVYLNQNTRLLVIMLEAKCVISFQHLGSIVDVTNATSGKNKHDIMLY